MDAQHTRIAYIELGAPKPPQDSLAQLYKSGDAHETDIAPAKARYLGEMMRETARQLSLPRLCRNGLHPLTPENLVREKGGMRCKACRATSKARYRAA